ALCSRPVVAGRQQGGTAKEDGPHGPVPRGIGVSRRAERLVNIIGVGHGRDCTGGWEGRGWGTPPAISRWRAVLDTCGGGCDDAAHAKLDTDSPEAPSRRRCRAE